MHLGEQPGLKVKDWTTDETVQVYGQLEEGMKRIHDAGFLHVDPRFPNFMYFPHTEKYDWIDYDRAVRMDSDGCANIQLQKGSGHFNALPGYVKKAFESNSHRYRWTKREDVAMMTHSFWGWVLKNKNIR